MAARDDWPVPQNAAQFVKLLRWKDEYVKAWEFLKENDVEVNMLNPVRRPGFRRSRLRIPLLTTLQLPPPAPGLSEDEERARLLVIERLLQLGADPNLEIDNVLNTTSSPFADAVHWLDVPAVELMLQYGGDPLRETKHVDGKMQTALDVAIRRLETLRDSYDSAVMLLEKEGPLANDTVASQTRIRQLEESVALNLELIDKAEQILQMLREKTAPKTKNARFSRAQIREALDRFDGNHKAAARFLFKRG